MLRRIVALFAVLLLPAMLPLAIAWAAEPVSNEDAAKPQLAPAESTATEGSAAADQEIRDLTQAILVNSGVTAPYDARCEAWFNKGEFDRSIEEFDEAIRLDPNELTDYKLPGTAYSLQGMHNAVTVDFAAIVHLDPKAWADDVLDGDSSCCGAAWGQNQFEKLLDSGSKASKLDPQDRPPIEHRTATSECKRNYEQAIEDCGATMRLDPRDISRFLRWGVFSFSSFGLR